MNEQAVSVVCAILSAICAGLFWAAAKYDDQGAMIVGMVFSITVTLLSGYVMICRYL
jgi:hypothetical protein